ncbi:FkbM family methyltransferase [Dyella acidisoli]|uniref:SAM-dependent methyltransferase n=1 Tax=Dyella acidisoli TaxID=1867834 RepID=A0ABQ5XVG2_9GAMM|nr:FkbM family methyltransferase [Dyella acidisoli]GLQ94395.1 SAM-dependent methyltransferase [Dyella acidisoli]
MMQANTTGFVLTNKEELIFRKKHSRLAFLRECYRWLMVQLLRKQSGKHIADNRKQLVVFSFDFIAHNINLNGVYEKDDLDTFFEWSESYGIDFKEATVLDVGANIGNHSLYFSDYFKRVVSFEPHPRIFKVLSLNADLVTNMSCHNVGLSDQDGSAILSGPATNFGRSTISESRDSKSVDIKLVKLDEFCEFENIKLLKIDVEGHEYKALLGARKIIQAHKPIILFEQHIDDFINGESKVLSLLKEFGYKNFATVRRYPLPLPSFLKFVLTPLLRIVLGEQTKIVLTSTVKPDFYSFIIALPGWVLKVSDYEEEAGSANAKAESVKDKEAELELR